MTIQNTRINDIDVQIEKLQTLLKALEDSLVTDGPTGGIADGALKTLINDFKVKLAELEKQKQLEEIEEKIAKANQQITETENSKVPGGFIPSTKLDEFIFELANKIKELEAQKKEILDQIGKSNVSDKLIAIDTKMAANLLAQIDSKGGNGLSFIAANASNKLAQQLNDLVAQRTEVLRQTGRPSPA